jgi:hypothetical protein
VYFRCHRGSGPSNPEQLCSQSASEHVVRFLQLATIYILVRVFQNITASFHLFQVAYGAQMISEHGPRYDWMNQPIDRQVVACET